MIFDQAEYDIRFEWGGEGLALLAGQLEESDCAPYLIDDAYRCWEA